MKIILLSTCLTALLLLTACGNDSASQVTAQAAMQTKGDAAAAGDDSMLAVNLSIGEKVYPVKLYDNESARELIRRMPLELDMDELHGNEKYYYFTESLPTDTQSIERIAAGNLMLYGSDCLVLFYEDFQTSFHYTRLGYLENPDGLAEAVGSGSITITLEAANAAHKK